MLRGKEEISTYKDNRKNNADNATKPPDNETEKRRQSPKMLRIPLEDTFFPKMKVGKLMRGELQDNRRKAKVSKDRQRRQSRKCIPIPLFHWCQKVRNGQQHQWACYDPPH